MRLASTVTSLPLASPRVRDEQERGGPKAAAPGTTLLLHCGARGLCLGAGPGAAGQRGGPGGVRPQRCRRLGQAPRLYLLNLALADVLFTLTLPLWLTYYLGPAHWPFPEGRLPRSRGRLLCVHLRGRGLRGAFLISVPLQLRAPAWAQGGRPPGLAPPRPRPRRVRRRLAGRPGLLHPRWPPCTRQPWGRAAPLLPGAAGRAPAWPTPPWPSSPPPSCWCSVAYVSLARAPASPSGPGPPPPVRTGARPGPWCWGSCWPSPSAWRPPSAAGALGNGAEVAASAKAGMPGHLRSNGPTHPQPGVAESQQLPWTLIYCFSVRRFRQDCLALSCRLGVGGIWGDFSASLASSLEGSLARCLLPPLAPPSRVLGGGSLCKDVIPI